MYWYVLFVQTGREHKVEQFLKERLDSVNFMPFVPLQEILFKKAGTVKRELKPLFPGYVLVESRLSSQEFIKRIGSLIYASPNIIVLLRYSDTEIAMKEAERQLLLALCNDGHCVESSSGIIEGDRIYVTHGPLKGCESLVRRINRHKMQAWIEIELMGELRTINVALNILEKN